MFVGAVFAIIYQHQPRTLSGKFSLEKVHDKKAHQNELFLHATVWKSWWKWKKLQTHLTHFYVENFNIKILVQSRMKFLMREINAFWAWKSFVDEFYSRIFVKTFSFHFWSLTEPPFFIFHGNKFLNYSVKYRNSRETLLWNTSNVCILYKASKNVERMGRTWGCYAIIQYERTREQLNWLLVWNLVKKKKNRKVQGDEEMKSEYVVASLLHFYIYISSTSSLSSPFWNRKESNLNVMKRNDTRDWSQHGFFYLLHSLECMYTSREWKPIEFPILEREQRTNLTVLFLWTLIGLEDFSITHISIVWWHFLKFL